MRTMTMAFLAILSVGNFESPALASFNGKAIPVANSGSITLAQADHEQAPADFSAIDVARLHIDAIVEQLASWSG